MSISVFSHTVERRASVEISQFAKLMDPRIPQLLGDLTTQLLKTSELESSISESLYEVIAKTAGKERQSLIGFRRDIFKRRNRWRKNRLARDKVSVASPSLGVDLDSLEQLLASAESLTSRANTRLRERTAEEYSSLLQLSGSAEFASALSLSSPSTWDARERAVQSEASKGRAKLMRSLFYYAQRGALKPGPLSTFTMITVRGASSPSVSPVPRSHAAVAAVRALIHALCTHQDFLDSFLFLPNPTLVTQGKDNARMLSPMYQRIEGQFNWRRDDVLQVELPSDIVEQAQNLPSQVKGSAVEEHFGNAVALRFLVDTGIVLPVLPWRTKAESPLNELARTLPSDHKITKILNEAENTIGRLSNSTPNERVASIGQVRQNFGHVFQILERAQPIFTNVRDVVRENYIGAARSKTPEECSPLAVTASGIYSEGLFRGVLHDALVSHTRRIAGKPHGRVVIKDVPDLLAHLSHGATNVQRYQTTLMEEIALAERYEDRGAIAKDRPVLNTPSTPHPFGMAIIHEHPAGTTGMLESIGTDGLGQFTRYLHGDMRPGLVDELRRWASDTDPTYIETLEVTVATDQNDLQRDASGIWPALKWPLDSHVDAGQIGVQDLMLTIHEDDSVTLTKSDDRPVRLVYVGAVPQTQISGPVRNLLALTSPWSFLPPDLSVYTRAHIEIGRPLVRERETRDGLVTARKSLQCDINEIPESFLREITAHSLRELMCFLNEWGFGEEFYVQLIPKMRSFVPPPKPSWVSLGSIAALEALQNALVRGRERHHMKVTEAFPSVGDHLTAESRSIVQNMYLLAGRGAPR